MNIGMILIMIIGGLTGVLSTLYLTLSLPVILGYKLYRVIRYHYSLYD